MATGHFAGRDVPTATLAPEYADYEAFAWIGVVYSGSAPVTGSASAVNGHGVGDRFISLTADSNDTVTALIQ